MTLAAAAQLSDVSHASTPLQPRAPSLQAPRPQSLISLRLTLHTLAHQPTIHVTTRTVMSDNTETAGHQRPALIVNATLTDKSDVPRPSALQ